MLSAFDIASNLYQRFKKVKEFIKIHNLKIFYNVVLNSGTEYIFLWHTQDMGYQGYHTRI